MQRQLAHKYEDIISVENLLAAWREFVSGKRAKRDVQEFSLHLMDNILALRTDLANKTYRHGSYRHFKISDPKPRDIHKSGVRDRLLHHAIHRISYPYFDKHFIFDSYSCRLDKGTHKALDRFKEFSRKATRNYHRTAWILKCDIRKFFASVDQEVLLGILARVIPDKDILWLLGQVLDSFSTAGKTRVGLPLGNLTSQLLVNIYMNEFDQFVKHELKAKYYIRYADDFVFLSDDRLWLEGLIPQIREFLTERLKLELHPNKLFMKTVASGVDFLGWVHFPEHRVFRTSSKNRMVRRLNIHPTEGTVASYRGLLTHGNAYGLTSEYLKLPTDGSWTP